MSKARLNTLAEGSAWSSAGKQGQGSEGGSTVRHYSLLPGLKSQLCPPASGTQECSSHCRGLMVQQHPALLHGFRSAKRGLKPKLHRGGPDRFRGKPSAPHGQLLLKLGSRTIVFRIFFFFNSNQEICWILPNVSSLWSLQGRKRKGTKVQNMFFNGWGCTGTQVSGALPLSYSPSPFLF